MNNTIGKNLKIIKIPLRVIPVLIVGIFIGLGFYLYSFNNTVHVTEAGDETSAAYATVAPRTDSTASWPKEDFKWLDGQLIPSLGRIYDVTVYNNSSYDISNWTLRVDIQADCYLNNFWNGTVEIHQGVNSEEGEKVQTLNLGNGLKEYDSSEIELVYTNKSDPDQNLYIPLYKGDYMIYHPASGNFDEVPLKKGLSRTVGFILYYRNEPDVSCYQLSYNFHRTIFDSHPFYINVGLFVIWAFLLVVYITTNLAYKRAQRELELKKSGILSMSAAYSIIYIVNLKDNTLLPVVADEESEKLRPKDIGANEQLQNLFEYDSDDRYKDIMVKFADLDTLSDRLRSRSNIVCEYVSKNYGWCRVRFFAMDREPGQLLEKALFTIRVINEEKQELEDAAKRVNQAEMESKAKSTFLANMSHEIRTPINTVLGLDTMILRESREKGTIAYAKNIRNAANMLLSLINSILDFSKLEADKMELVDSEYSLKKMLSDVQMMVANRFESKNLVLTFDVAADIPDKLRGDDMRLKQILINLLTNAEKYTNEGHVRLSVYGKIENDSAQLLFSVKDTGIGIREEDMKNLAQRFSRLDEKRVHKIEGTGIGLNLVSGLLGLMNSELKVVSEFGKGSEFYFEIEQKIADPAPIGTVDFTALEDDNDEAYEASFTAPEAKVLVVDDNSMNLIVFENLLKETGLQIDKASSGTQALNMTLEKKYDLIFMDHMMPAPDGVETFKLICSQEDGLNRDTPEIMLTANALEGMAEEFRKIGFAGFISKPIQPTELEATIMQLLDPSKYTKGKAAPKKATTQAEIPAIEGLDITYGMEHAGGIDSLLKLMKQFTLMGKSDLEELNQYYGALQENPENADAMSSYRIKVHAMKSSARVMGAFKVSGLAETLEEAARNAQEKEIQDIHPYFEEQWKVLTDRITNYMRSTEEEGDKADLDMEALRTLLHQLETAIKAYDFKTSDQLVAKLDGYAFEGEKADLMTELKSAVANLDADKTTEICGKLAR